MLHLAADVLLVLAEDEEVDEEENIFLPKLFLPLFGSHIL